MALLLTNVIKNKRLHTGKSPENEWQIRVLRIISFIFNNQQTESAEEISDDPDGNRKQTTIDDRLAVLTWENAWRAPDNTRDSCFLCRVVKGVDLTGFTLPRPQTPA